MNTPQSAAGWGCTLGCLGIGLLFLFMFAMLADVIFLWPIGSVLQLGEWIYNPPHGDSDGGWTFRFEAPYDAMESGFTTVIFLSFLALIAYVLFSKPSSIQQSRNPRFRNTQQAPETPSGLLASLQRKPVELLVNFDSRREEKLDRGLRSLFGAPFALGLGLHLANLLALNVLPTVLLGGGTTRQRFALLLACSFPGIYYFLRGMGALSARLKINDQLLFDFESGQIFEVDLNDTKGKQRPKLLYGFSQVDKIRLLRVFRHSGELERCSLSLVVQDQAKAIGLVRSRQEAEHQACEELLVLLAELLKAEMEELKETLPEPSD